MIVNNHNHALDAHTAILSSLTPMNAQNKSLRASLLVSLIMSRLDEKQLNEINIRNKTSNGWDYLNSIIGEGTMDDELEGFIETELTAMRDAQTIFCTSEILDEIQEAQTTMLDDILLPQDVFVPNGFMVLETPYKYCIINCLFGSILVTEPSSKVYSSRVVYRIT